MKKFILIIAALALAVCGRAQSTAQVERSVLTQAPQVETRTYEKDGKVVTERVTTTKLTEIEAVSQIPNKTRKAAIFIANRVGKSMDDKMMVLEDMVTAKATEGGFQIISREIAADAMRSFDAATASAGRPANSLEAKLTDQSSALRIAQNLGADYLLLATITSLGDAVRSITIPNSGDKLKIHETTLRLTYRILDGQTGASLATDTITEKDQTGQTEGATVVNNDLVNTLLDNASNKLADSLKSRVAQNAVATPSAQASMVAVTFKVEAADLLIPDVRVDKDNTIAISESKLKIYPLSVTVEVDGVAVGTAPGTVKLRPGFSKIRLTREGFKPYQQMINAYDGQVITAAMMLNEEGYSRWLKSTAFVNELKNGAKLTDAQVERIKGEAKMLEQSGYKVDVKVNTKEALTIKSVRNSIFGE